jgi:hypothetical protein
MIDLESNLRNAGADWRKRSLDAIRTSEQRIVAMASPAPATFVIPSLAAIVAVGVLATVLLTPVPTPPVSSQKVAVQAPPAITVAPLPSRPGPINPPSEHRSTLVATVEREAADAIVSLERTADALAPTDPLRAWQHYDALYRTCKRTGDARAASFRTKAMSLARRLGDSTWTPD